MYEMISMLIVDYLMYSMTNAAGACLGDLRLPGVSRNL